MPKSHILTYSNKRNSKFEFTHTQFPPYLPSSVDEYVRRLDVPVYDPELRVQVVEGGDDGEGDLAQNVLGDLLLSHLEEGNKGVGIKLKNLNSIPGRQ